MIDEPAACDAETEKGEMSVDVFVTAFELSVMEIWPFMWWGVSGLSDAEEQRTWSGGLSHLESGWTWGGWACYQYCWHTRVKIPKSSLPYVREGSLLKK